MGQPELLAGIAHFAVNEEFKLLAAPCFAAPPVQSIDAVLFGGFTRPSVCRIQCPGVSSLSLVPSLRTRFLPLRLSEADTTAPHCIDPHLLAPPHALSALPLAPGAQQCLYNERCLASLYSSQPEHEGARGSCPRDMGATACTSESLSTLVVLSPLPQPLSAPLCRAAATAHNKSAHSWPASACRSDDLGWDRRYALGTCWTAATPKVYPPTHT
jgi:hypothetical protein